MPDEYDEYSDAADELTEEIRQLSPAAADCIEQIRAKFGTRPAYLAAFALIIYRERLHRAGKSAPIEDLKSFTYYEEMRDIGEAIQLYEEAAAHLQAGSNREDGLVIE
nr:hypothetical protein [uncultured bacterium]